MSPTPLILTVLKDLAILLWTLLYDMVPPPPPPCLAFSLIGFKRIIFLGIFVRGFKRAAGNLGCSEGRTLASDFWP